MVKLTSISFKIVEQSLAIFLPTYWTGSTTTWRKNNRIWKKSALPLIHCKVVHLLSRYGEIWLISLRIPSSAIFVGFSPPSTVFKVEEMAHRPNKLLFKKWLIARSNFYFEDLDKGVTKLEKLETRIGSSKATTLSNNTFFLLNSLCSFQKVKKFKFDFFILVDWQF